MKILTFSEFLEQSKELNEAPKPSDTLEAQYKGKKFEYTVELTNKGFEVRIQDIQGVITQGSDTIEIIDYGNRKPKAQYSLKMNTDPNKMSFDEVQIEIYKVLIRL